MAVPDGKKVVSGWNEIRYDACYTLDYQESNGTEDLASTTKPENAFAHIPSLNSESRYECHTMIVLLTNNLRIQNIIHQKFLTFTA